MKWLEGLFGTVSGALGARWVAFVALVIPSAQTSGRWSCTSSSDGVMTWCITNYGLATPSPPPAPSTVLLIVLGVIVPLFIGVLVGTWLDLSGARRAGRTTLLISATLLIFAPMGDFRAIGALGGFPFAYLFFVLLALITCILAYVRSDTPRHMPSTT